MKTVLAVRYARGILAWAGAEKTEKAILPQLENLVKVMKANPQLTKALTYPAFPLAERAEILLDVGKKLKMDDEGLRVLSLLAQSGRAALLPDLVRQIQQQVWRAKRLVPLEIESAAPLSGEEKEALEKRFSHQFHADVVAQYAVGTGMGGGVRVKTQGRTFDATVQGWFNSLEEQLLR